MSCSIVTSFTVNNQSGKILEKVNLKNNGETIIKTNVSLGKNSICTGNCLSFKPSNIFVNNQEVVRIIDKSYDTIKIYSITLRNFTGIDGTFFLDITGIIICGF